MIVTFLAIVGGAALVGIVGFFGLRWLINDMGRRGDLP